MRIDKIHINDFKNLRDFDMNIDEEEMYTVLLGQNAAGKSNFLEALVILFRDLFLDKDPQFSYTIEYRCNGYIIQVIARHDHSSKKDKYRIIVKEKEDKQTAELFDTEKEISRTQFKKRQADFLPRYLIAYYSGISNRLEEHFDAHQKIFYDELLKGEDDPLRPLFYARPIHSNFVLMSFFSFAEEDEKIKEFLKEYFGIIGLDSILFVIKRPGWAKAKDRKLIEKDKISFWRAKGTVSELLKELYSISLAPIQDSTKVPVDFRRDETQDRVYLYISNVEKLRALAANYSDNVNFFKVLESTYISDFIHDVRIKVKKKDAEGNITFKEMSEGEQQLLTVLGLLRFTKSEESLILLDEPDTHLNPLWKWRYIKLLRDIVDKPGSTQIIMTSHDPLVIGSLRKEEIRLFFQALVGEQNKIFTEQPEFDPKGLGVAGILTSEFFDLPSILDEETYNELHEMRELQVLNRSQQLSGEEQQHLEDLERDLDKKGLDKVQRDPLYQRFIEAVYQIPELKRPPKDRKERERQNQRMLEVLKEITEEENSL